jgi:hypothetical protein
VRRFATALHVMPGLGPGIHEFSQGGGQVCMPGTGPGHGAMRPVTHETTYSAATPSPGTVCRTSACATS